jgi:glycosyltransferase involved in cell wall biosynthesis
MRHLPDPAKPARSRRLAFLLPNLGGGGAERVALTIIKDFLERGHEVDLVLVEARGALLEQVPHAVNVVDLGARRMAAALPPLVRYFRERRPDAIQIRMWPLTVIGILAHRLARSKTRVVLSDHVALSEQYGHLPVTFALLRASVRLLYPLADERLLVSSGAADDLAAISGLPRDRFHVVYNPAPPATAVAVPPEIEGLWAGADGRIITVGALKAQKNHALLIRAFAELRRRRAAKLIILGEGALRAELEAQVACEGLTEEILFRGFVRDPAPYLASADLFVLSSDYEGFGNVLIEAMQLGISLVSTDCRSGPSEILGHGRFGKLVPCGDAGALAKAMEAGLAKPIDPALLREQAERLSGQASIDRYFELMTAGL